VEGKGGLLSPSPLQQFKDIGKVIKGEVEETRMGADGTKNPGFH